MGEKQKKKSRITKGTITEEIKPVFNEDKPVF